MIGLRKLQLQSIRDDVQGDMYKYNIVIIQFLNPGSVE